MATGADTTRNLLLRRADWRFLVGVPDPERAYCPAPGVLRDAVAAIAGRLVDRPSPGECDLAVLLAPSARQLRQAHAALEPGGGLYVEWWHPVAGGLRTVRKRLEQAGFEQVACYWPWPAPRWGAPRFWLPLEMPEVADWLLHRPAAQRGGRAAAIARRSWHMLWRIGALVPVCAGARKRDPASGSTAAAPRARGSGRSLPSTLAAHSAWSAGESSVGCLLLTGGRSPVNKLVTLTFRPGERTPHLALKLARIVETQAPLDHEGRVLQVLHGERPRPSIPRLVARVKIGDRVGVAESVMTGRPLQELLGPATHRELCLKVTGFLADLATDANPRWSSSSHERIAAAVAGALRGDEQRRIQAILSRLPALPEVSEHRDCSPWNVLVRDDGELAILDWESAEERGVPGLDLVYFLSYASFVVDRSLHTGGELDSYRRMLGGSEPTARVYAECTTAYAERVGLDPACLTPLRLLCWLVHAWSGGVRAGDAGSARSRRDGSLFLQLARHELARQEAGA
jgi:hypothetical protein